ncbi:MAG TPA: MlaD family protein [Polyangiaceae bacterium]|nr:MlaD family protein [Polyangiaceae bacterium]HMR74266.1 MlaD family protein [Polyangiaceae bacterium]
MNRVSTAAKVGAFALVMVVAAVFIYRFVSKNASGSDGYQVYALFDDATGIAKHSQVRVAGIPIGQIENIRLQDGKARIDIKVRPDVPLYEDAAASKVTSSLLGEYFIGLAPGTEGKRQLEDGDEIKIVVGAATTDEILKDVSAITKQVKKVVDSLAASIGSKEGEDNLKDTLKNLAEVTDALNKTVRENRGSIRNILSNVENITKKGEPEVDRILENVRESSKEIRELLAKGEKGEGADAGEVRQIIEKVNRASTSLERALGNLDTVSGRLERGEGTLGRLTKDEKLIDEVEGVAQDVGEFVGGLSRLQTIVALRTDYQFLSSTVKSYVELRLQPREDKYYSIEIVNDPRGLTRFEQIDVDTSNPNDPPHYREVRTVTTNAFRFSLQFAQRMGPFVGRFGIKESTGGVGLDTLWLDDRFELRQDLFGFGEVVLPRWRIALGYEFVSRLWMLAGVDDVLSPDRRDYFLGLQLRFNDEDLKTILPFAPGP